MRPRVTINRLLYAVSAVNIVLASIVIFSPIYNFSAEVTSAESASTSVDQTHTNQAGDVPQNDIISEQSGPSVPIRLVIPKINVDAALEHVGLTADGAVGTPKNQNNAAWFELGRRPGEIGSAIIAGHYGWKNKKSSAFDNLYKLREGDVIYINDEGGVTTTFIVRELKRYGPDAKAIDVFGTDDNQAHLNLVTCEGVWNDDTKSYSARLVVFTDLVQEK